jgi:hypothetical protein
MKKAIVMLAAVAALGASAGAFAQTTNATDDVHVLISQIQTDKRAIVLQALDLTDGEVAAFTPIYDEYQGEMKKLALRTSDLIDKFAANYASMTDDAAKDILKEWFDVRDERMDTLKKYAKKVGKVLPATKTLRWVQVENKLMALVDWQAAQIIPLSK